jgi:hypothetical protein
MVSSGLLRRVAFVRTDVSEKFTASLIRVKRIREPVTTLQESHGVESKKTEFFIVTAVKPQILHSINWQSFVTET